MNKLLLDGKEVDTLVPQSLPMLIHGEEGSGASLYTITLAVKWFSQGYDLLFLCGYPMAEQEFAKQVQSKYRNVQFYTKEHVEGFKKAISFPLSSKTVVFVKNIELFHDEVFQVVSGIENLVLSGNLNQAHSTWIANEKFTTSIYFSPFQNEDLSMIKKYQGLVVSGDYRGVTRLES